MLAVKEGVQEATKLELVKRTLSGWDLVCPALDLVEKKRTGEA